MTKTPFFLCAALALAACDNGKNYKDLTAPERVAFEKCRGEFVNPQQMVEDAKKPNGYKIVGEKNAKAIEECTKRLNVNPKSVPGYR